MAITDNPFLAKTFQTVQMIANNNMQMQSEQRQQERQIAAEDRANQRFEERRASEMAQNEYNDLTKSIMDYRKNVTAGAEPDPEQLNAIVNRRNTLIETGGVTPRMFSAINEPGKPQKPGDEKVSLDPVIAKYFKYPEGMLVSPETKRILSYQYRSLTKPDKAGGGDGTAAQKNANDPLVRLAGLRKDAADRYNKGAKTKGDTENLGIDDKSYQDYLKTIDSIEADYRNKKITKEEANKKITDAGTFDVRRLKLENMGKQTDEKLSELKSILEQIKGD